MLSERKLETWAWICCVSGELAHESAGRRTVSVGLTVVLFCENPPWAPSDLGLYNGPGPSLSLLGMVADRELWGGLRAQQARQVLQLFSDFVLWKPAWRSWGGPSRARTGAQVSDLQPVRGSRWGAS